MISTTTMTKSQVQQQEQVVASKMDSPPSGCSSTVPRHRRQRVIRFQDEEEQEEQSKPQQQLKEEDHDTVSTCSTTDHSDDEDDFLFDESFSSLEDDDDQDYLAPNERIAVWGTPGDVFRRRYNLQQDVQEYKRYGRRNSDNMTFSSLGLKDKAGIGKQLKQQAREAALEAVRTEIFTQYDHYLDESQHNENEEDDGVVPPPLQYQDSMILQSRAHFLNHESLALVYQQATQESKQKAYEEALQLAKDVQQLLLTTTPTPTTQE